MAEWRTAVGLFFSGLGLIFSFSSFVFLFFGNYHAAVWSFLSGILAAIDFHLLFLHWRRTLGSWHTISTIKDIEILAITGLTFGLAATAWYIFMFVYFNLPVLPIDTSYPIASVWAFMTAKWGLGLLLTTRHLARIIDEEYPPLLPPTPYFRCTHYYYRIQQ